MNFIHSVLLRTFAATFAIAGGQCAAAPTRVSSVAQFQSVLKTAKPGDIIDLAPGRYPMNIADFHGKATIKSGTFTQGQISNSSGLDFQDNEFDAAGAKVTSGSIHDTMAFVVAGSSDIHFERPKVHGDPNGTLANTAGGLFIRESENVTVEDGDFSYLANAVGHQNTPHLTITGNACHAVYDDCIRGGGSSWLLISHNHAWSNHPDPTDTDHPDFIQIWQDGQTVASHDITVTDNRHERGTGHVTQCVFIETQPTGTSNVTIARNTCLGSMWNGIAVFGATNLIVTDNNVTPLCVADGPVTTTWIRLDNIAGLTLTGNAAALYLIDGKDNGPPAGNKVTKCH